MIYIDAKKPNPNNNQRLVKLFNQEYLPSQSLQLNHPFICFLVPEKPSIVVSIRMPNETFDVQLLDSQSERYQNLSAKVINSVSLS